MTIFYFIKELKKYSLPEKTRNPVRRSCLKRLKDNVLRCFIGLFKEYYNDFIDYIHS